MLIQNHAYREGRTGVPVLMLSVAGRFEQIHARPAAAGAGVHLDQILLRLHAARPDIVPYANSAAYPILNAHPGVEYKELTGRTEAPVSEYVAPENIARVIQYVAGRQIIAFGGRARTTCRRAKLPWVMTGLHPSSLNRIPNRLVPGGTAQERMRMRYDLSAARMLKSLRDPEG